MPEQGGGEARRFWLMALCAAWALAWAGSVLAFWAPWPAGERAPGAPDRFTAFLGWQGVAGMLALGVWGVGRAWPRRSPVRRVAAVPLLLLGAAVAGVAAAALIAGGQR